MLEIRFKPLKIFLDSGCMNPKAANVGIELTLTLTKSYGYIAGDL